MGKPCQIKSGNSKFNVGKYTRGSETSQYPEEKKINKIISLVAASEKEEAQTDEQHTVYKYKFVGCMLLIGVVGWKRRIYSRRVKKGYIN